MITVDISGPAGNAFSVMTVVTTTMRKLGCRPYEIKNIQSDMTSSDYDHLIETANNALIGVVEFVNC